MPGVFRSPVGLPARDPGDIFHARSSGADRVGENVHVAFTLLSHAIQISLKVLLSVSLEEQTAPAVSVCGGAGVLSATQRQPSAPDVATTLDEVPLTAFHRKAVFLAGVGFFTDAYDLFIVGIALEVLKGSWQLSTAEVSAAASATLLGAVIGAFVFGRVADRIGRKPVYALVAALMVLGALASAFAPDLTVLIAARFVLGLGVGGDYPISAALASEYANRADRGRMVALVFSMQAVGLVVGPAVGLGLVAAGLPDWLSWRLMLGLGAVPAALIIYLRARMPESPRFTAEVLGQAAKARRDLESLTGARGHDPAAAVPAAPQRIPAVRLLADRRLLRLVIGTAGAWFLLDYAYYGNTLSTPMILDRLAPNANLVTRLALTLGLFTAFAVPGYVLAVYRMDRIGHKRLQLLGFAVMAACLLVLAGWPGITSTLAPFVAIYGISYLFTEFGPNTTTFVLPSEVFPASLRATGHGVAAGVGKIGAFAGVFLFPLLAAGFGVRGSLLAAAIAALAGFAVTLLLPEPAGRSLTSLTDSMRKAEPAGVR